MAGVGENSSSLECIIGVINDLQLDSLGQFSEMNFENGRTVHLTFFLSETNINRSNKSAESPVPCCPAAPGRKWSIRFSSGVEDSCESSYIWLVLSGCPRDGDVSVIYCQKQIVPLKLGNFLEVYIHNYLWQKNRILAVRRRPCCEDTNNTLC